jgi:hypothetical protein
LSDFHVIGLANWKVTNVGSASESNKEETPENTGGRGWIG